MPETSTAAQQEAAAERYWQTLIARDRAARAADSSRAVSMSLIAA